MAELKTTPNDASPQDFVAGIADTRRRGEASSVLAMMTEVTGAAPTMWGTRIVGFGRIQYRNAAGQGVEWMAIGLSPRKAQLTLYLMGGFEGYGELLASLGPHTTGKSCLYLKRLDAVDDATLRELVRRSYERTTARGG